MRKIKAFTFEPGDRVEFELTPYGDRNIPRWSERNEDAGFSGNWTQGIVLGVTDEEIEVTYEIENYIGSGLCRFPNIKNEHFNRTQWCWPGYMKHLKIKPVPICECGGSSAKTTHSRWCPMYK